MATDPNLKKQYDDMKDNKKFVEKNPSYDKFCENINPNFKAEVAQPPVKKEGDKNDGNTNADTEKK